MTITRPATGGGTRTLKDKVLETVTVADFGDAVSSGYVVGSGGDDKLAIQAFFNYIAANRVTNAIFSGNLKISGTVTLDCDNDDITNTTSLQCNAVINATQAMDVMFDVVQVPRVNFTGSLLLVGHTTNSQVAIASRYAKVGLRIRGGGGGELSVIQVLNTIYAGVEVVSASGENNNCMNVGQIQAYWCGSGSPTSGLSKTSTFTGWVDQGSAESFAQRTRLTVATLPDSYLGDGTAANIAGAGVIIAGNAYNIEQIDRANSYVYLFPWVDAADHADGGTLTYVWGGGLVLQGADSNVISAKGLVAVDCGIGLNHATVYGPAGMVLTTESCGFGLRVGRNEAQTTIGGRIDYYHENNTFDIVAASEAIRDFYVSASYDDPNHGLLTKLVSTCAPRRSGGTPANGLAQIHMGFNSAPAIPTIRYADAFGERINQKPYHLHDYYDFSTTFTFWPQRPYHQSIAPDPPGHREPLHRRL